MSILLLDADPGTAARLAAHLGRRGTAAHAVSSVPDALRHLDREPVPDAVVVDLDLPGMTGFQFVAGLAADPVWRLAPIVACASTPTEEVVRTAARRGIRGLLLKPVAPDVLESRLREMLDAPAPITDPPADLERRLGLTRSELHDLALTVADYLEMTLAELEMVVSADPAEAVVIARRLRESAVLFGGCGLVDALDVLIRCTTTQQQARGLALVAREAARFRQALMDSLVHAGAPRRISA